MKLALIAIGTVSISLSLVTGKEDESESSTHNQHIKSVYDDIDTKNDETESSEDKEKENYDQEKEEIESTEHDNEGADNKSKSKENESAKDKNEDTEGSENDSTDTEEDPFFGQTCKEKDDMKLFEKKKNCYDGTSKCFCLLGHIECICIY